jgi:hypothetical protein
MFTLLDDSFLGSWLYFLFSYYTFIFTERQEFFKGARYCLSYPWAQYNI